MSSSYVHGFLFVMSSVFPQPAKTEKPPVCKTQTKAAFIQPVFPKGIEPILFPLKHRNIKQFQYTLSPLKSIGKTLSEAATAQGFGLVEGAGLGILH